MARAMSDNKPFLPPEWAPQAALWCGWPHLANEWGGSLEGPRQQIAGFIRAAADHLPVRVAAGSAEALASATAAVGDVAKVVELPAGDIWLRDTGPIVTGQGETRVAQTFRFNGWGGKYLMPGDTETAAAIATYETLPATPHDIVLEGGAIDADGTGRLLTTRQCLLNPNRNPDLTADEIEARICAALGIDEMIWLGDGLLNDHTDGHVDNIARFVAPGVVVCQTPWGEDDPHAERIEEIASQLQGVRDARGRVLQVIRIPSPGRVTDDAGEVVPASHMNFIIGASTVVVPTYGSQSADTAVAELQKLFPDRTVVGSPAKNILTGGGAFHCITQQQPA